MGDKVPNEIWEKKDRRIARLACIKAAAEVHGHMATTADRSVEQREAMTDSIIKMARRFELEYIYE